MIVERDLRKMEYVVHINKDELHNAFTTEENFYNFLRELTINTVGEEIANDLFPIIEEEENEHDS